MDITAFRIGPTTWARFGGCAFALASACHVEELDALKALPLDDSGATAIPDGDAIATNDGSAPTDSADDTGSESPDVGASLVCTTAIAPVVSSTFDTTDDSWILSSSSTDTQVTMSWYGGSGDPAPGSLAVDFTGTASDASGPAVIWVHEEMTAIDLTGRTVSAWVWLDSGPSPQFLSFVQTETAYAWGDNGEMLLTPGVWTCISLSVSSPATSQTNYDPTHVIRIGFEMIATARFRVLIDSVRAE